MQLYANWKNYKPNFILHAFIKVWSSSLSYSTPKKNISIFPSDRNYRLQAQCKGSWGAQASPGPAEPARVSEGRADPHTAEPAAPSSGGSRSGAAASSRTRALRPQLCWGNRGSGTRATSSSFQWGHMAQKSNCSPAKLRRDAVKTSAFTWHTFVRSLMFFPTQMTTMAIPTSCRIREYHCSLMNTATA